MTFLTLVACAILIVGLVAVAALYRIERKLKAWREPAPFEPSEVDTQLRRTQYALDELGNKRPFSPERPALQQEARKELLKLSRMIQANARVRSGEELLLDAQGRVAREEIEDIERRLENLLQEQETA